MLMPHVRVPKCNWNRCKLKLLILTTTRGQPEAIYTDAHREARGVLHCSLWVVSREG